MSTNPSVREFESDRRLALLAGAAMSAMGLTQVGLTIAFAGDGVPVLFGAAGLLLLACSAAAFTYREHVTIDVTAGRVLRTRIVLSFRRESMYWLRDFQAVGIGTASRTLNHGRTSVSYFLQLLGASNITLPGSFTDEARALESARELAETLLLPLEERPRAVFFGKRF